MPYESKTERPVISDIKATGEVRMLKQTESKWYPLNPDLVLYNGNIITVDNDFSIAEAVAVKDAWIIEVGRLFLLTYLR